MSCETPELSRLFSHSEAGTIPIPSVSSQLVLLPSADIHSLSIPGNSGNELDNLLDDYQDPATEVADWRNPGYLPSPPTPHSSIPAPLARASAGS